MATVQSSLSRCEPSHFSAYSEDLYWHMVYQYRALHLTYMYEAIGSNLCVDPSTVCKLCNCFAVQAVWIRQYNASNLPKKIDGHSTASITSWFWSILG